MPCSRCDTFIELRWMNYWIRVAMSVNQEAVHDCQFTSRLVFAVCSCAGLRISILQEGYGEFQVCQDKGVRADAYRQYLKPVLGRSNLKVLTNAQTIGVEFDNSRSGQPVARGVTYQTSGPDSTKQTGEHTRWRHSFGVFIGQSTKC